MGRNLLKTVARAKALASPFFARRASYSWAFRMHHLFALSLLQLGVFQIFSVLYCCLMVSGLWYGWVFSNSSVQLIIHLAWTYFRQILPAISCISCNLLSCGSLQGINTFGVVLIWWGAVMTTFLNLRMGISSGKSACTDWMTWDVMEESACLGENISLWQTFMSPWTANDKMGLRPICVLSPMEFNWKALRRTKQ